MWHGPGQKYFRTTMLTGTALTPEIDLTPGFCISSILLPVGFQGTILSFQGGDGPGGTYRDTYDSAIPPNEVVAGLRADGNIILDPSVIAGLKGLRFLKIRAGSTVSPQVQAGDRAIVLCTHFF